MLIRPAAMLAVAATVAAVPAVAGVTSVGVSPLPDDRSGVIVSVRPRAGTGIVALDSGRLLAVHALRGSRPGTRVRVDGIKWGTPTPGIKWGPAQGIKWGVRRAANGSYQSNLTQTGVARTAALRGTVIRRPRGGVVIGTRAGVVAIRGAVWLPTTRRGKSLNGVSQLPGVGDTVLVKVRFGKRGRLIMTSGQVLPVPRARSLALAGRVSEIVSATRTIRLSNVSDPAFALHVTMSVPTSIDVAKIQAGREVAATAGITDTGALRLESISPNESFAAANDPAAQLVAPPPADAETLTLIQRTLDRWDTGRAAGQISDAGVYELNRERLVRAETAARDGATSVAAAELNAFINAVAAAIPVIVTPATAADVLALASAALDRLPG